MSFPKDTTKPVRFQNIRAALYSQPWAIRENDLRTICEIFEANAASVQLDFEAKQPAQRDPSAPPFDFTDGVATIPIRGPIFPRANLMTRYSGATSLDDLSAKLDIADSLEPSAIIFDIDSPGGVVIGALDFVNEIRAASQASTYPILALCNGMTCSLAYMLGCGCDMIYATEGSIVGSIGVIMAMDNWDRAERNMGNDPVVLRSSELKAIGSGGGVTESQTNEMRRMMLNWFDQFKGVVSSARRGIDIEAVSTGQVWHARSPNANPSAQDMGLIDGVKTLRGLQAEYARK